MTIGMILQATPEIRRECAQIPRSALAGFRSFGKHRSIGAKADAPERQVGVGCLNRYPSPSCWSGSSRVRPTLSSVVRRGFNTRRQPADWRKTVGITIAFFCAIRLCFSQGSKTKGLRACALDLLRRQDLSHSLWQRAAIHLPNNHLSGQARGPARPRCWMATSLLAHWSGPRATSPTATSTRNAADPALNQLFGQPDATKNAAPVPLRGGGFVLPVQFPRGPKSKRAA